MAKTLHSGNITFIDLTDTKKLDVHISSNLPTTQIYDVNNLKHTPDWTKDDKLKLTLTVYADSTDITDDLSDIKWYRQIGNTTKSDPIQIGSKVLTISTNELTDPSIGGSVGVISYLCSITYNGKTAENQITFSRTNTGLNGTNGTDGTSVRIKGTAQSVTPVENTDYYTIVYSDNSIDLAEEGDAYVYDGDLYVCVGMQAQDGDDYFINVGRIQGPAGESAKSIILNGSSQVFRVSKAGYTPTTITVTAQTLNTAVTTWEYSTNGGSQWASSAPGVTRSDDGIITITGEDLTSNSIVIKASDGIYSDTYTVYKAFDGTDGAKGADGQPASMAFLTNENVTFGANASGVITSATISTNVVAYNGATKTTPTVGTIANLPTGMTATIGTVVNNEVPIVFTVTNSNLGSALNNNGSITIPVNGPSVYTNLILTWSKVNSGAQGPQGAQGIDAYTVLLTNESHVFAGDITNAVVSTAETQALAYIGTTPQTVKIISVNEKTAATIDTDTGIDGLKFKCDTLSGTSPKITFTCTTAFKSASGTIPIKLSVGGVEFTKMFTYSIAFKGATGGTGDTGPKGDAATAYWLVSSASVVNKTSTGTIAVTPSTLTFTGKSQTGTNAPIDYACRWIIAYSTDGTNYTNLYTSTANEASKSITVATTYKTIRVRMYMAGGTTALLDEQIIPVVVDGAKGDKGDKGSQGDRGVGISSVTVTYGTSTSASTQPTSWQTTLPTVAEGSYLWTRTVTDYTDTSIADTVTLTYAKQGVKGDTGSAGTSVTVSKIEYQAGTSATTAPTGTWSNSVVAVAEGNYLWTKTTFSDGKVAYGVAKQGEKGSAGADAYTVILTNESHVFAGNISSAIASNTTTQVMAYKGSASQSVTIVSVDGKTASTSSTATSITGLSFACSALSGTTPTITFTCTTSFVSPSGTIPIVVKVDGVTITKMFTYGIAFKGATGSQGTTGTAASLVDITPSAHYFKSTTGKDGAFTPDYIYLYPRFQTVTFSKWEYSINGGTTWIAASGANGISIGTYNSIGNTLRLARTSTLYTDIITSISFRCVSSNSAVYDTVSIAKIYDVVDLQLEGRNLVLNSNQNVTSDTYRTFIYDMSEDWVGGNTYTISIKGNINEGQNFGVWANGSATRVTTLTYDASKGLYTSTFVASTSIVTQTSKTLHVYNTPSDTATESSIEWIKLEKGSKLTAYTPAPEDYKSVNFQIYAPNGYLLTNDLQSLTLQTFAYDGSIEITSGATFQWSHLIDDVWTNISDATSTTLTVTKSDVLKAKSYRCVMTYKEKTYTSTITVQDKTDTYNSIMCISSNTKGSECYWVLYTLVYSDTSEIDPLLGPISISAPASPVNGDYWYAVDSVNAIVQLKKYNGTTWANSTDKQSLTYLWNIVNDGSVKTPIGGASKVQVVSCHDFTATATLMCDISNESDGILTQSSLSITDASDPIVSQTEPASAVDGQIWIKPNTNGAYNMFVWSEAAQTWIASDMDTRNKVYTSKPSSYSRGDIWITESNTVHSKYLEGTLLQASQDNTVYNENDWSSTLKYDKDIAKINSTLYDLSQYVTITSSGLKIGAVNSDKELSPFTSLFTSTELAFYQNSDKLLTLANNQLTAPRIVVEEELEVDKKISLGDLQITIESNGSFSFAVTK